MEVHAQLTTAAIPQLLPLQPAAHSGAWVEFRGLVRDQESGATISALEYEAYSPMAETQMQRIIQDIASRQRCSIVHVIHRIGIVPVGEAAIYVGVAAKHRAEAFAMLGEFMDRLKQDVPIWKIRALTAQELAASASPAPAREQAQSADVVIDLVRRACGVLGEESVPLAAARGRVLRRAVVAAEHLPPFDRSSVDGFAVRMDDAGSRFQVIDEIRAGAWKPLALKAGEAVRVATGGAIPSEGLQVLMKEDVRAENGSVTVMRRDAERNIRFRGEDARKGQELVPAGSVLKPGALGLLASAGCVTPVVTRLPVVLHLATGDEIVGPAESPLPGQIRDSNSTLVQAFLAEWGIVPNQRRVGEDEAAIWDALNGAEHPDLLLISGGASVGEHDFTQRLLQRAGFQIDVSKTTARPGKPLIVARRDQTLAFGLPGNPLAHFVCLNLYVRAALESWSGQACRSAFERGYLAGELEAGASQRETFWPARWRLDQGRPSVVPLRWSSSGDITSLSEANALIRVAAGALRLAVGAQIEFLPTNRTFA